MRFRCLGVAVALAVVALANGCTSTAGQGSADPVSATSATTATSGTPVTPSASVPVTPSASRPAGTPTRRQLSLGGSCDSLLPLAQIWQSSGLTFAGLTRFVVGVPKPNIGRLAYLNCRYGIPPQHGANADGAADRDRDQPVPHTRAGPGAGPRHRLRLPLQQRHRSHPDRRRTARRPAQQRGRAGYDAPLLVLAAGQRTIAVSIAGRAGTSATRWRAMAALTALALARTGR